MDVLTAALGVANDAARSAVLNNEHTYVSCPVRTGRACVSCRTCVVKHADPRPPASVVGEGYDLVLR